MSAPNGDYVRIPLSGSFDDQVNSELHGTLEHETNVESQPAESITSPLTFKFYQHYFDVDTSQVVHRLASALVPNPRTNFIQHSLKPHADLYGPFWIATTLILAAAIGGNVSNYLQSRGAVSSWHYDFQKVTLTSTIIYVYWWLMPLILHAFIHFHRKNKKPQSNDSESDLTDLLDRSDTDSSSYRNKKHSNNFLDVLSTYGYSLAVFVPVSILWTIQISILQWLLFLLAVVVSGAFLIFTLMPSIRKEHPKVRKCLLYGLLKCPDTAKWGEFALEILSYSQAFIASAKEVLLAAFMSLAVLRKLERKRRASSFKLGW
ncbi:Protein YIPF1 like [Schistosoma japonicum]|nr:Protein YIPF1 like [Schistosoma japonicum]